MYTVTYFETYCDDGEPEAVREYFSTYEEALPYLKSFEDWEEVRLDYIKPVDPCDIPF
jgi:hypothetical protein